MSSEPLSLQRARRTSGRDAGPRIAGSLRWWLRIAGLLFVAQVLALALQALLLEQRERELLQRVTLSRIGIAADEVHALAARAAANGLLLTESTALARLLPELAAADPAILGIVVADEAGQPVLRVPVGGAGHGLPATAARRLEVARELQGALGERSGSVRFDVDGAPLAMQERQGRAAGLQRLGLVVLAVAPALALLLALCGRGPRRWRLRTRLLVASLLLAGASSLALSLAALPSLHERVAPALDAKAERVATFLAQRVTAALALGIPFDGLTGVDAYVEELTSRHPEIRSLRLVEGAPRAVAGATADATDGAIVVAVTGADGQPVARLEAVVDPGVAARELRAIAADLTIVFVVAVLVFNEVLGAILARAGGTLSASAVPAAAAAGTDALGLARLAVFLLILSEEVTRAFLPLYAAERVAGSALPLDLAIGLPIAAYMASFALLTPFAGHWAARFGAARVFAAGAMLSAVGFGMVLLAESFTGFVLARCLCAAGYAVGTMAIQHQFLQGSDAASRTRALALLVGAVQTAAICGAPLGGLLADRLGSAAVFGTAALLGLLALAVHRLDRPPPYGPAAGAQRPRLWPLLRLRRVWLPLLAAAVPVKLVLAGFLFYLVPIALDAEGFSRAEIGRAMLVYFLTVAASNPLASWLADHLGWQRALVIGGGIVIGVGGLAGLAHGAGADGVIVVLAGIFSLGLGTGLSAAALQALLARDGPGAVVLLRTVERLGAVVGPLLAGALLGAFAVGGVMAVLGAVMLGATLVFAFAATRPDVAR